jgi:hypothetical protein
VKGVTLKAAMAEKPQTILSCPVKVLLSIFEAYECCWGHLTSGAMVLGTVLADPWPMVEITWSGEVASESDIRAAMEGSVEWQEMREVMESLQGRVTWGDGAGFTLRFPPQISQE